MEKSTLSEWAEAHVALSRQVATSVVAVSDGGRRSIAGIYFAPDIIVTAAEPIVGASRLQVAGANDEVVDAARVGVDLSTDVAILRATLPGNPPSRGDSATLRAGQPVIVAGRNRHGFLLRWAAIAQVGPAWHSRRGGVLERAIRLAPGMDPEFEGSGVFDVEGRLCAMAVRGPRGRVTGIPVETLARVSARVEKHGYLPQPYLGLVLQPVALDEPTQGAAAGEQARALLVIGVDRGSPAAAAGTHVGDVILRQNNEPVDDPRAVTRALIAGEVGQMMHFDISRGGQRRELAVQVGERPRS